MEPYIVKYLLKKTKRDLEALKNETYPDNKGKIESENVALRTIFKYRTSHTLKRGHTHRREME